MEIRHEVENLGRKGVRRIPSITRVLTRCRRMVSPEARRGRSVEEMASHSELGCQTLMKEAVGEQWSRQQVAEVSKDARCTFW